MPQAIDEAGNIWEVDAQGNPVRFVGQAGAQAMTIGRPSAKAAYEAPLAAAQLENARLEVVKKQRELENDPNRPFVDPFDKLTGDAYLSRLPRQQADQVRALADGRMAFPTGRAASSPYWQKMLSAVAHYDPTFDAVNFQARQQARKDFTSGKSAQNIRALNTAIGHVGQLASQIDGTASHGGFPFATTVNAIENAARRGYGDSGPTNFDQTRSAVASELTQVFRGSGGAEADVKRYLEELSSNASLEQKRAAIRNIAGLLNSRLSEIGDQYNKAMGKTTDPVQLLNPHAQEIWNKILGPEGGSNGGPEGPGGVPPSPDLGLATGDQKFTPDEAGSRLATELARNGMSDDQINAALQAGGFAPLQPGSINSVREFLRQNPGFKGSVPGVGKFEQTSLLNRAAASPVGTFVGNVMVAGSAGLPVALGGQDAKQAFDLANENNPKSALAGGAVGGLTATLGAGKLLAPFSLGKFAAVNPRAAALLGDTLYGGTYGFNTADEGEGVQGALFGAAGGVIGNRVGAGITRAAGATMRGVVNPSVDYLRSRGVPMTGGQMLGGFAKSLEDKATSVPLLGDLILKRRQAGLNAFNDAAFQEAGDAIGYPARRSGVAGVEDLIGTPTMQGAAGRAYDAATAGVAAPLDSQFATDMIGAMRAGNSLPEDLSARFNLAMENRVKPAVDSGILTGDGYQQAIRGIKGYKAEAPKPGFEQDYRDALSAAQDALTGVVNRNSGPEVISGLQAADRSYKMGKVLQDAVKRARNGSRSGEAEIFTPSQLNDAASANRFSGNGTDRPFYELGKAGQDVLPSKVPDSGTAGRVLTYGLGAGLLGGAGGAEYQSSGGLGDTGTAAAGILALSLLNTKGGAKVVEKLLLGRPDIMRRFGQATINNASRAGMFGRGAGATYAGMLTN